MSDKIQDIPVSSEAEIVALLEAGKMPVVSLNTDPIPIQPNVESNLEKSDNEPISTADEYEETTATEGEEEDDDFEARAREKKRSSATGNEKGETRTSKSEESWMSEDNASKKGKVIFASASRQNLAESFDNFGRSIGENDQIDDENVTQNDHTFTKLQEIFERTLKSFEESDRKGVSLEPVKILFQNVWEGIERSHDNVVKLREKDHNVSVELSSVMAKTQTTIKLAEEDPVVCQKLKTKLETAWGLADVGEAEEKKNMNKINQFKDEINILNRSIEAAAKTEGQDTIAQLQKLKQGLEVDRMTTMTEASKLYSSVNNIKSKREQLSANAAALKDKMELTQQEINMQLKAIEKETNRKAQLDRDIVKVTKDIGKKIYELDTMDENVSEAQKKLAEAEKNLHSQRLINEEAIREKEQAGNHFLKMKDDFDKQITINDKLLKEIRRKEDEVKEREHELKDIKLDITATSRQYNINAKKWNLVMKTLEKIEADRNNLKEKLVILEENLNLAQKLLNENKKKVEALDKERSVINKRLQRVTDEASGYLHETKTQKVALRNLEVELTAFDKEIHFQQKGIERLEKERDNYILEATKLTHQVALRMDDIKKLNLTIFEYQRKLNEVETQLKKQQQILDATNYEKGLLTKTLRETENDIKDNIVRIHNLGHEATSLRFQLSEKDVIIRDGAENYERITKDTMFFTNESKRIKRLEYDLQKQIDALTVERSTLGRNIAEIEGEISKHNYYSKSVHARKEVYLRKLMAKDKEVKNIWEKWRALHSTIRIGAYHFRNTMDDIRMIRYEILQSKKENLVVNSASRSVQKLNHEISILENLISKEVCMTNSLKEQMKHPINVHRWRVLECVYPKSFELVQKTNILTKRLVERNNKLAQQAEDLQLKQQIYQQIRVALSKSPGLETPEKVRYFAHLLAAKRKQYATLQNEFKEAEAQTDYYKIEIMNIQKRVLDLKAKYFKRMRNAVKKAQFQRYPSKNQYEILLLLHAQEQRRREKLRKMSEGEEPGEHEGGEGEGDQAIHGEMTEPTRPLNQYIEAAQDLDTFVELFAKEQATQEAAAAEENNTDQIDNNQEHSTKRKKSLRQFNLLSL